MQGEFTWITYYQEFSKTLLTYSNNRKELHEIIKKLSKENTLMNYLHFEREDWWASKNFEIDPFSVLGIINRGATDANRTKLAKVLADTFDIKSSIPTTFNGIPVLNNQNSFFAGSDVLWSLFQEAMNVESINEITDDFCMTFDKAIAIPGNGPAYITMGLYWIKPHVFMPLDANSKAFILNRYGILEPKGDLFGIAYKDYLLKLDKSMSEEGKTLTFPQLSFDAWKNNTKKITGGQDANEKGDSYMVTPHEAFTKNMILCGPPGTGKTYNAVRYAVAIIEEKTLEMVTQEAYEAVYKRFIGYKEQGLIAFTTFHQSYSYEEFIEGIRPVLLSEENTDSKNEVEYELKSGLFKAFCDHAGTPLKSHSEDLGIGKNPNVWKVSLEGTGDNPTRTESLKNDHIRIGWDQYGREINDSTEFGEFGGRNVLNAFYNKMQIGDIVFSCYSSKTIDAIGIVTGEAEWDENYTNYKRLRKVKWIVKDIDEDIVDMNAGKTMTLPAVYKLSITVTDALQLIRKHRTELSKQLSKIPNRVFIIDEINRGNISKVFGELITLIESTKRIGASEEMRATLPYSGVNFGVPENVYILGTMNTADRSIALLDTALRRRFSFIEMLPDVKVLEGINVEGISISKMLDIMNKRIRVLLDREHTIGHSYFLSLKDQNNMEELSRVFKVNIFPLLQEYFYDDYDKISLILGDNQKQDQSKRFIQKLDNMTDLFGDVEIDSQQDYSINDEAFKMVEAYDYLK